MADVVSRTGGERTKLDWMSWEELPPPRLPVGVPLISALFVLIAVALVFAAVSIMLQILSASPVPGAQVLLLLLPYVVPLATLAYLLRSDIAKRFGPYAATGVAAPQRPVGVTLTGVLHFVYALIILAGLGYFLNIAAQGRPLGDVGVEFLGCLSAVVAVLSLGLMLLMISVGRGLLQLRTSGRSGALVIAVLLVLVGPTITLSIASRSDNGVWMALGTVLGMAMAVGSIAISYGLWKLRNWARLLAVVYLVLLALAFFVQAFAAQMLVQAVIAAVVGIAGVLFFKGRRNLGAQVRNALVALSLVVSFAIPLFLSAGDWSRLISPYGFLLSLFFVIYLIWPTVVEEFDKAEAW